MHIGGVGTRLSYLDLPPAMLWTQLGGMKTPKNQGKLQNSLSFGISHVGGYTGRRVKQVQCGKLAF